MDINEAFSNYFNNLHAVNISLYEIVQRLFVALIFSGLTALTYKFISKNSHTSQKLIESLVITSLTICIALIALSHSIPVSFGLFAALSIIRFRTPVKDLREITMIFISIVIGICCGIGALKLTFFGVGFILIAYLIISKLSHFKSSSNIYLLRLETLRNFDKNEIIRIFSELNIDHQILDSQSFQAANSHLSFEVSLQNPEVIFKLTEILEKKEGVISINSSSVKSIYEDI